MRALMSEVALVLLVSVALAAALTFGVALGTTDLPASLAVLSLLLTSMMAGPRRRRRLS